MQVEDKCLLRGVGIQRCRACKCNAGHALYGRNDSNEMGQKPDACGSETASVPGGSSTDSSPFGARSWGRAASDQLPPQPRVLYEGRQTTQARSNAGYLRQIIATYHLAAHSAPHVVLRGPAAATAARPTTSPEDLGLAARLRSTKRETLDAYEFNRLSREHGWGVIAQPRSHYYAEGGEVVREEGGTVLQKWSFR